MGYMSDLEDTEFMPTGLFIDKLTNGIPRGKVLEVYGKFSAGKTTLCLQVVAALQAQGYKCAWALVEKFDGMYAKKLGVDTSKLWTISGATGEDVLDSMIEAFESKKWDVIVWDSVGAITPRAELEKGVGETTMAGQSRIIGRFLRKMAPQFLPPTNNMTTLIGINQLRTNMQGLPYRPGGDQWDFHKDLSIFLKPKFGVVLKQGDRIMGEVITARIDKDKVLGHRKQEVDGQLIYGEGFSRTADIWEEAVQKGFAVKQGNTWMLQDEKIGTISKVRDWLKIAENADKLTELIKGV